MSLIEEYADKERELLEELLEKDNESVKTKKSIVVRLVEITRKLFELDYIPGLKKHDISSYVNGRLTEYGITYPRNQKWWMLFKDDEKRNYGTNSDLYLGINHTHKFEGENPARCECGAIIFDSIVYDVEEVDDEPIKITDGNIDKSGDQTTETSSSSTKATSQDKKIENDLTDYLSRIANNAWELSIIARDFNRKYQTDAKLGGKPIREAMDRALKELPKLIEEQKSTQALLIHISKSADLRQKIGEFEKVKAIMLEKHVYNTAKVAKLLAGISPKHMTNNIKVKEPEFTKNLNWFKTIFITFPKDYKKGDTYPLNLASWYALQLERMDIGLHQQEVKLL